MLAYGTVIVRTKKDGSTTIMDVELEDSYADAESRATRQNSKGILPDNLHWAVARIEVI